MTKFTLHEVWEIMRDLSVYSGGNTAYKEAAEARAKMIEELEEAHRADFEDKAQTIQLAMQGLNGQTDAITRDILNEKGLTAEMATWHSRDLLSFISGAQVKGAFSELVISGVLAVPNLELAFSYIEPEDGEEATEEEEVGGE